MEKLKRDSFLFISNSPAPTKGIKITDEFDIFILIVAAVQLLSCVWLFPTPWTAVHQAPLSSAISQSLLKFTCSEECVCVDAIVRLSWWLGTETCSSYLSRSHWAYKLQSFSGLSLFRSFPGGTSGKEPTCQCRRPRRYSLIPGSGRSPGGGHGNPLQCSCLENPTDRGAWQAPVHGSQRVRHD